jgi:hypothetical protein
LGETLGACLAGADDCQGKAGVNKNLERRSDCFVRSSMGSDKKQ